MVETVDQASMPSQPQVRLREWKLNSVLGITTDVAQVDESLARLDFAVTQRKSTDRGVEWEVIAPSHRFDIAIEADLIEEVCRIYGYNNIPVTKPTVRLPLAQVDLQRHSERQLRERLAGLGFQEVVTYSFVDPKVEAILNQSVGLQAKMLANPMSSEQSVMRTSLLAGLIEAAKKNAARQQDSGRLFEVGLVFKPPRGEALDLQQDLTVGGILWGRRSPEAWLSDGAAVDFFDAKGVVEELALWAGLTLSYRPLADDAMHPGQSAAVLLDDRQIGRVGRLHPTVEKALDTEQVFVFELDGATILQKPRRGHGRVSRYPAVRRDIAVVVNRQVSAQSVMDVLSRGMDNVCTNITLFDVYEGEGIDSQEKSLAIGLTLQSQETTLGEDEINAAAQSAMALLQHHCGARLR
jgi:phenylalanyl-tRNA synthetase beta chain